MKADELKTLRQRLGMNQQQLADVLWVSRNTVTRWEMGQREPEGPALKLLMLLDVMNGKMPDVRRVTNDGGGE